MSTTIAAQPVCSYVLGGWHTPRESGDGTLLRDASTGAAIARVGDPGVALSDVVDYGRSAGQASLGALGFHERALILKGLAKALDAAKDALYALSATTGATARDSWIDIDGGIGVLYTYASKGRRELPNAQLIVDGPPETLARDGSFGGQHVYTRLPGVAVQVNAFNFPVWGMLEKLAPAFLAGVPSIVKPATPTAHVAEAAVRVMADSGLLPDGTLQFIGGPARELAQLLDLRDSLAFTGSAATGRRFAVADAVLDAGLRLGKETDSLNCAILGPDAEPGTPEFDAYVASVVTEMTAKAGQKCTAVRRVIVPADRVADVIGAIRERLADTVALGDPRVEGTTMGPLASLDQKTEVLHAIDQLRAGGGEVVIGGGLDPEVPHADGRRATAPEGAFLEPTLLRFGDADADAVHSVEPFGPVASVIGYRDLADAVRLARRGGGSLVATVASADAGAVAALVGGIAPFHGRVLVLDRDDARTSTGHGSPVPHLVHGGPGRAGGGEELGGIRAVTHYMQRTALQGSPAVLTALTGVWRAGAPTRADGPHPFRRSLAELSAGDTLVSDWREVTLEDIAHFAEFTGDTFYAHTDEEAAAANPFFPGRVAHGYLLVSFAAGLFVEPAPGPVLANYGLENLRFLTPVSPGDRIRVQLTAAQISPRVSEDYGEVRWAASIVNQDEQPVATYDVLTLVAKTTDGAPAAA